MKQIEKDKRVVLQPGSHVVRGTATVPEKLTASVRGTVVEGPLTRYKGRTEIPRPDGTPMSVAMRLVILPGKIESQRVELAVLPTARILAVG